MFGVGGPVAAHGRAVAADAVAIGRVALCRRAYAATTSAVVMMTQIRDSVFDGAAMAAMNDPEPARAYTQNMVCPFQRYSSRPEDATAKGHLVLRRCHCCSATLEGWG